MLALLSCPLRISITVCSDAPVLFVGVGNCALAREPALPPAVGSPWLASVASCSFLVLYQ